MRRSFQFFVLMLSSSMASYEKTLPVVLIAAMWVLLLKTYWKRLGLHFLLK